MPRRLHFAVSSFCCCVQLLCKATTFLLHFYQRREPVDTCYNISSALFNEVAASMVQGILQSSVSLSVTSVTRGCAHGSEVYAFNSSGDFRHVFMTRTSLALPSSRPPRRRSSSTIIDTFNSFLVYTATRTLTRVSIAAAENSLF